MNKPTSSQLCFLIPGDHFGVTTEHVPRGAGGTLMRNVARRLEWIGERQSLSGLREAVNPG